MADATTSEATSVAERELLDAREDGAAWARMRLPAMPSLADRAAAHRWRDLVVDPALAGLAPERARPTALVVGHGEGPGWEVPVVGLVGCGLAWHPHRPLVAGLACEGGRAHPWVADHRTRTVRHFRHVRAATSLTELDRPGRRPLWWRGGGHLATLAPGEPERAPEPPGDEPLVFEAAGPAHVSFEPGLDDLAAVAGAAVVDLDVDTGAVTTLTPPLLVRRVALREDGSLAVEHATGIRPGGPPADGGLTWATGRAGASTAPGRGPGPFEPVGPAGRPAPPARTARRRPGCAPEPAAGGPRVASDVRTFVPPGGEHAARLALFPPPSAPPPEALDPSEAAAPVLWVRAASRPPGAEPVHEPPVLAAAGGGGAVLDLPLAWPGDATVGHLHEQVVGAIAAGADALAGAARPVVVGGHSFGATLALYGLAHVPGLAAGMAQSGCYNRTLTPHGFQYERRPYWEAPDVYAAFSALLFADRIRRPVLLVHGLEDVNPATHPDQAVELYRALVATAGHARLVLLPGEGHNVRCRESHRHLARVHRDWARRVWP